MTLLREFNFYKQCQQVCYYFLYLCISNNSLTLLVMKLSWFVLDGATKQARKPFNFPFIDFISLLINSNNNNNNNDFT